MTSTTERNTILTLVEESVASGARQARSCEVIELSERTLQRWKSDRRQEATDRRMSRVQKPQNALSLEEREEVLSVANSPEFGHLPPSQMVPRLADQGRYLASESTIHRILKQEKMLTHRRAEKPRQVRSKPRSLQATGPNQVFSWDITYLPSQIKGKYFYLYMFIDVFSRKVVGWQVYHSESSTAASEIIRDICLREKIGPNQTVLHSDNGSPMKGATMLGMLQSLGVMPSFSRPAVSNDNPYAESFFKTLKYHSKYPHQPFKDLLDARHWTASFMDWYNEEHRHSGIQFVTPAQRHANLDAAILEKRTEVYEAAKAAKPNRWSGSIRNWERCGVVNLNPDKVTKTSETMEEKYQDKLAA